MILANLITIAKYGINIFLAILGFISFDDINQKTINNIDQNNPTIENVNYVESLQEGDYSLSKSLYYADQFYFDTEKDYPDVQIANQIDDSFQKAPPELNVCNDNDLAVLEDCLILKSDIIKDFEILILQVNDKVEFEYLIKVVEAKSIMRKVINSSKTLQVSYFNSTY